MHVLRCSVVSASEYAVISFTDVEQILLNVDNTTFGKYTAWYR